MIYRVISPIPEGLDATAINALQERAYIQASELVLPAGMIGLMVAAMASATASMATTQLNVYAGALTTEVYKRLLRPPAKERELLWAGRVATLLLGGIVLFGALFIPSASTYTDYIIAFAAMVTGPLVLPTIWGLFSKRIGLAAAWITTLVGGFTAMVVKFGFREGGWFRPTGFFDCIGADWVIAFTSPVYDMVALNPRVADLACGTSATLAALVLFEFFGRSEASGVRRVMQNRAQRAEEGTPVPPILPARICGSALLVVGLLIALIAIGKSEMTGIMLLVALTLAILGAIVLGLARKAARSIG
jgi:Na+/proline symporter